MAWLQLYVMIHELNRKVGSLLSMKIFISKCTVYYTVRMPCPVLPVIEMISFIFKNSCLLMVIMILHVRTPTVIEGVLANGTYKSLFALRCKLSKFALLWCRLVMVLEMMNKWFLMKSKTKEISHASDPFFMFLEFMSFWQKSQANSWIFSPQITSYCKCTALFLMPLSVCMPLQSDLREILDFKTRKPLLWKRLNNYRRHWLTRHQICVFCRQLFRCLLWLCHHLDGVEQSFLFLKTEGFM